MPASSSAGESEVPSKKGLDPEKEDEGRPSVGAPGGGSSRGGTTPKAPGKRILHVLGKGGELKRNSGALAEPSPSAPEGPAMERKSSERKLTADPLQRSMSMESSSNTMIPERGGTPGRLGSGKPTGIIDFAAKSEEAVTPRVQERRQSEVMTSSDLRNLKSAVSGISSTFQREVQETLKAFKEVSESIRTGKIYALTETHLLDWSTRIEGLSNLITDIVQTGITSISDALDPSAKKAMEESNRKVRKFNFAEVVRKVETVVQHSQGLKGQVVDPKTNVVMPKLTPRKPQQQQGDGSTLPLGLSVNAGSRPRKLSADSGEKPTVAANYFKHSTSSTFMDTAAVGEALQTNRRAQCMAASLHVILDSVMRTTKSEKVCVYVPFRGDIGDLCVVSAVGYGPDVNLHDLRLRDAHSVPSLTLQTGMLIAVCRGHNPAREVQETMAQLKQSIHDNPFRNHLVPLDNDATFAGDKPTGPDQSVNSATGSGSHRTANVSTPTQAAVGTPKSIVQLHRAKYWSGLSVPVRLFNQVKPTAVLQVVNKNFGNSNYDAEDEHYLHGVAQLIAGLFERFDDFDMLVKLFDPQLPLPAVHSAGAIHGVTPRGLREQLVYHTWDTAHGREVKILLGDGPQNQVATKLDDTTPLTRVVDYIVKLQEMWKQSVLANLEYQKAHQDRTAYVKMLVDRVRMAELRCEVLTSDALKNVHIDENTKPTWFLPSNRESEIGFLVPQEVGESSPLTAATTKVSPVQSVVGAEVGRRSAQTLASQESSECFNMDMDLSLVDASTQTDGVNPLLQDLPDTHPLSRGELLDLDGGVAGRSTGSIAGSKHSLNKPYPLSSMTKEVRQEKLNGEGGQASFRVGGEIGRGAHGTVHSALIEETGETVAAKKIMMSTQLPDDELDTKLESLQLELNLLKALDHPNIVRYLFSRRLPTEEGQGLLIFMEFVAGGSLQSIVSDFGALSERTAAIFAAQILLGLEYLHSKQVIHRDIKPANCLVGHLGEVKLSDFGTAMLTDSSALLPHSTGTSGGTALGAPTFSFSGSFSGRNTPATVNPQPSSDPPKYRFAGTPLYMAPEVIQKKPYTAAVDIWSFACTVMELVTGQVPWTHWKLSVKELLMELTKGSDPLPMPPGLSPELTNFLQICLQREPSKRPTASELIAHPWFAAFDILELAPSTGDVPLDLSERSFNLKVSVRDEFASSVIQGFGASLNVSRPSPMPASPVTATAKAAPEPRPQVESPSIRSVGSAEEDDGGWTEEVVVPQPSSSAAA